MSGRKKEMWERENRFNIDREIEGSRREKEMWERERDLGRRKRFNIERERERERDVGERKRFGKKKEVQ